MSGSINRVSQKAGWVDFKSLPKGPNGRSLCRECREEVPKSRRSFCGDECVDRWKLKTNPGYVREQVFNRDKGVCAGCGLDTEAFRLDKARKEAYQQKLTEKGHYTRSWDAEHRHQWFIQETGHPHWPKKNLGLSGALWEADHILEVMRGGGETGLENYQTLCLGCHRRKTAQLAKVRQELLQEFKQTSDGKRLVTARKQELATWNRLKKANKAEWHAGRPYHEAVYAFEQGFKQYLVLKAKLLDANGTERNGTGETESRAGTGVEPHIAIMLEENKNRQMNLSSL